MLELLTEQKENIFFCFYLQNDISVTLSAQQKQQKYHMTRKVKEVY